MFSESYEESPVVGSSNKNKLEAFYSALKWGGLPQKNAKLINKFFEF